MSIITFSLSLFIPILMFIYGLVFYIFPLKKLNSTFGYRSKVSLSSQDAWDYAQKLMSRTWLIVGIFTLILSYFLLTLLSVSQDVAVITLVSLQMVILYSSYLFVDKKLKKRF